MNFFKPIVKFFTWYNNILMAKPIRTSSATAAVLGGAGDAIN